MTHFDPQNRTFGHILTCNAEFPPIFQVKLILVKTRVFRTKKKEVKNDNLFYLKTEKKPIILPLERFEPTCDLTLQTCQTKQQIEMN